jgi:hypothetical protein
VILFFSDYICLLQTNQIYILIFYYQLVFHIFLSNSNNFLIITFSYLLFFHFICGCNHFLFKLKKNKFLIIFTYRDMKLATNEHNKRTKLKLDFFFVIFCLI